MVLYNAGKAARNAALITNNTNNFGIMGGLAPLLGKPTAAKSYLQLRAATKLVIPASPQAGYAYMKQKNLLSVNPLASGGVGRKVLLYSR